MTNNKSGINLVMVMVFTTNIPSFIPFTLIYPNVANRIRKTNILRAFNLKIGNILPIMSTRALATAASADVAERTNKITVRKPK